MKKDTGLPKKGVVIGKRKNPVGWVHTNGYRRFKIRDHEGKNLMLAFIVYRRIRNMARRFTRRDTWLDI